MSEQYNSREDREASRRLAGNIDSDIWKLSFAAGRRGREGRQAQSTIAQLRDAQAGIIGGDANRTAGAADRRSVNSAALVAGQMQQQGEMHRAALDASTRTDIAQMQDATAREALVQRPTLQSDANGNLLSVSGTTATPVTGADGSTIRMPQAAAAGQITPAMQYETLSQQIDTLLGTGTAGGIDPAAYEQRLATLTAQRDALLQPGQQVIRPGQTPTLEQFLIAARPSNPSATDAELREFYSNTYGAR